MEISVDDDEEIIRRAAFYKDLEQKSRLYEKKEFLIRLENALDDVWYIPVLCNYDATKFRTLRKVLFSDIIKTLELKIKGH